MSLGPERAVTALLASLMPVAIGRFKAPQFRQISRVSECLQEQTVHSLVGRELLFQRPHVNRINAVAEIGLLVQVQQSDNQPSFTRWPTGNFQRVNFTRLVDEPTVLFLSIPEDEAQRLEPLSACL